MNDRTRTWIIGFPLIVLLLLGCNYVVSTVHCHLPPLSTWTADLAWHFRLCPSNDLTEFEQRQQQLQERNR
jgi:hypothetical protein